MSLQNDRSQSRESQCAGKIGYRSQGEARAMVKRIQRTQGAVGKQQVYQCTFCGRWHHGHKRRKKNPGGWRNPIR